MNLQNRNRLTDLEKELMVAGGKDGGRDSWGVWDGHGQTDILWITSKALLHSAGNSAQSYMAAWMGVKCGGEWILVYVWQSPFAVHLNYHDRLYSNTK